jgi:hypothetical protein
MSRLVLICALAVTAALPLGATASPACTPSQVLVAGACVSGTCAYGWLGTTAWQTTTC